MITTHRFLILVTSLLTIISCKQQPTSEDQVKDSPTQIQLNTTKGNIVVKLYNQTPKHRDNFIKLAKDSILNGVLFHRVIKDFMIQSGDIKSKDAKPQDTLGEGELPYRVSAEFHPDLFHKKGVLAAARDGNLERASSSTQFYIVQGKIQNDSLLQLNEDRINGWLREHKFKNSFKHKDLVNALQQAEIVGDQTLYKKLNDSIIKLAKEFEDFERYTIPKEHRKVYKTIGGTPHLDQNYTVFGEVVSGLNIVDSIANAETNNLDRPLTDIRIKSVKILEQ
jgi:peptidyl-prolyl cis-trans isomerase B (cyclophilin B)